MAATGADIKDASEEHEEIAQSQQSSTFLGLFQEVIENYGGAQQYLLQKYPGHADRADFAAALLHHFPRQEEVEY